MISGGRRFKRGLSISWIMPSCGERLVWIILEVLLLNNLSNKQKQGAPLLFSYYSFFSGRCPVGDTMRVPHTELLLWLGNSPDPFFQGVALWGIPPNPIRGQALGFFHQPQPLLHKKGLRTTLQTSRQSLAGGLVDSESWLSPSKFWYGSRAFALPGVITPSRVRHVFLRRLR